MGAVLKRFADTPLEHKAVFGITDSHERGHHIQSYWIYFRPNVAPLAIEFLERLPTIATRDDAVRAGELALSAFLRQRECHLVAYSPASEVIERTACFRRVLPSFLELGLRRVMRRPRYSRRVDGLCLRYLIGRDDAYLFNTSIDFGVILYQRRLSPFVKRELLRDNPPQDPAVPAGIEVERLDNRGVGLLLESHR
jgi:hypothetical protein